VTLSAREPGWLCFLFCFCYCLFVCLVVVLFIWMVRAVGCLTCRNSMPIRRGFSISYS